MYSATFLQDPDFIRVLYIVAFICFILGLRLLNHPRTARRGNMIAAVGMAIAVVATLLYDFVGDYLLIAVGMAVGTAVGTPAAQREDDRDAADGGAVQRRGRRSGGAYLVRGVPRRARAPRPPPSWRS